MAGDTPAARVLLVDDELHIRSACAEALRRVGHEVIEAESGETAHQAMAAAVFDAAVLDIVLPDTDGLKLLGDLRSSNPDAVVVLITGFASLDTAMEAVRLGAYEYLRKPFAAHELVRIINRGLAESGAHADVRRAPHDALPVGDELSGRHEEPARQMRLGGDQLGAFMDLGRRLGEGRDLQGTLRSILQAGLELTRAAAAAVYRVQDRPAELQGVAAVGLAEGDVLGASLPVGEGLVGTVAAHGVTRVENDVLAPAIADDRYLSYLGVQSVLASPLLWDGRVGGVLAFFDHEQSNFTGQSVELAGVLAGQVARVVAMMEPPRPTSRIDTTGDEFIDLADLL
ncbi:MAG TPA: response regulator [Armatimonadota bacterium]|nr:response regulator [Armatimonadota bacterium]